MALSIGKRGKILNFISLNMFLKEKLFSDFQLHIERKTSLEIQTAPICKFSASRSLSCTMELNVTPSCLLINGLGYELFIIEPITQKECRVPSNYIMVPMTFQVNIRKKIWNTWSLSIFTNKLLSLFQSGFFVKFQSQDEWITLPKIRLMDEKNVARNTSYFLPEEGSTIIAEKIANRFVKLCLSSVNENSARIISLQPHFVLCNFSKYQFNFHAFCIHRNEKLTYSDVTKLLIEKSKLISMVNNASTVDNT